MVGLIARAKAVWEWFSLANEVATALGIFQRVAAGAAVVATAAAVPMAVKAVREKVDPGAALSQPASVAGPSYLDPKIAQIWKDEPGKVFHSSYLINNREVLAYILVTCKNGTENNMARCEQATNASNMIIAEARRIRLNGAFR